MKIAVGSKNAVKVNAVKEVFEEKEFTLVSDNVSSDVSEQPFSDQETVQGAMNRAYNVLKSTEASIGIGLEGGVVETPQGIYLCNWGALTDGDITVTAGGARILLPDEFRTPLLEGVELGVLMDEYTKKIEVGKNEGAVGIFTNGRLKRKDMFVHIVELLRGQYEYKKNN